MTTPDRGAEPQESSMRRYRTDWLDAIVRRSSRPPRVRRPPGVTLSTVCAIEPTRRWLLARGLRLGVAHSDGVSVVARRVQP